MTQTSRWSAVAFWAINLTFALILWDGGHVAAQQPIAGVVSVSSSALPTGASTESTLTAHSVLFGSVTETAPASDTASSGLNGRLQRIAQRLTTLIGLFPSSLGSGGGVKVDIVSGAGTGGTSATDEGTFTLAASSGTPAMGYYNSTPDTLASGKVGVFGMTQGRALYVSYRNEDGTVAALATDATHGSTAGTTGPLAMHEAASDVSANAAVSDGQNVRAAADVIGRAIEIVGCDRVGRLRGRATSTGTEASVFSAPGSGVYAEVWGGMVSNTSATDVEVNLLDGSGGTIVFTIPAPAGAGASFSLPIPITFSANTAVYMDPTASASTITVTLVGCKGK